MPTALQVVYGKIYRVHGPLGLRRCSQNHNYDALWLVTLLAKLSVSSGQESMQTQLERWKDETNGANDPVLKLPLTSVAAC